MIACHVIYISPRPTIYPPKSQSQLTCSLTLGSRKFELVKEFIYLGTQLTAKYNISAEIRRRITLASRCLYGLSKHLRSKMLSRTTILMLYNTLIVPVLIYDAEAWTMLRWKDSVLEDYQKLGVSLACRTAALNRAVWRGLIH